jgi:hypothetical protein
VSLLRICCQMRWPGDCIANAHAGDPQAKARFPLKDAGDLDSKIKRSSVFR